MSDLGLKIQIDTVANNAGVQQAATGVKDIASAAAKAAPAMGKVGAESKNTAQELGRGVEIGNAAVATLTNIASSGQGGAAGLIAITRAGFSAGTMFKGLLASMGPFGIAAAAVGIAVGLISAALRKSEASAKAAEERLAALNKVKLDEAAREQDKLRTAAEATLRVLEAEARAKEEIADAELAKRKAIVRADARDSGEAADVTERKLLALDRQRDDEKRAAALDLLREKTSRLAAEEARQTKAAEEQAAKAAKQQQLLDTLNARERAAQAIPETTSAMGLPTANPAYARAQEELAAARAAADGISAETVKQQQAAAEALAKAAAEAKRTADEARTTLDIESRKKGAIDPIIQATRAAENRAATPQSEAETAARQKQIDRLKRSGRSVVDNQIAGGADVSEAAYTAAFGADAWAKRPKSLYSAPASGAPSGDSAKTAEAIGDAADAAKAMDSGAATATAAEALKKNMEASAAAQAQAAAATQAGLSAAAAVAAELAASVSQALSAIMQTRAELAQVKSQVATMRNRSAQ